MSIPSFIDYILLEKKSSLHTQKAYQSNLEAFQSFLISEGASKELEEVSYSEIRSWIVALIEKGNSTNCFMSFFVIISFSVIMALN